MNSTRSSHVESPAIWAVVLAAGWSRRMGTPKALLNVSGATFLEWIIRRISVATIDHAVVAISNDDSNIINNIDLSKVGIVYNATHRNKGAIGSIRAAITYAANHMVDFMMVWPVDHPCVGQETVNSILQATLQFRPAVTVPIFNGRRGHPVVFSRDTFSQLMSPEADQGARAVVHGMADRVHDVQVTDPGIAANIDTPSDYQSLIENWHWQT